MRIAWLEQSGEMQDRVALSQELINEDVSFYRFNWRYGDEDPYANVFSDERLSWSKGRERLFDAARQGEYDYYIFVDDDIVFDISITEAIQRIKMELLELSPAILTLASDTWQENYLRSQRGTVAIFATDLQVQIIRADIATESFPATFDGGWGTLWYPMFQANKIAPGSVLNMRDVSVLNTRGSDTGDYGGVENRNAAEIWKRSERYMPIHAKVVGRLFGYRTAVKLLNAAYARLWVRAARQR